MIQSITLKNTATYDNNGITISNLKKINFIYGANGSGKTTISNFLHNPKNSNYNDCEIKWTNDTPYRTLVYNKSFRDQNFTNSEINGVFTIGQATQEEIENIDKKKVELEELKSELTQKLDLRKTRNKTLQNEQKQFKEDIWNIAYKKYEDNFKPAFTGFMRKEAFSTKVLREFGDNISPMLTKEELVSKSKTIFDSKIELYVSLSIPNYQDLLNINNDVIWNKKIIGKSDVDIAKLIQKLNINDWVNEGRSYLKDDNICPFCQQETISDSFKLQLEEYFDKSFMDDITLLNNNYQNYIRLSNNILGELYQIESTEKNNPNTKLSMQSFSAHLKTLESQLNINKELISNKEKEPSRSITLQSIEEQLKVIEQELRNCNKEIDNHNKIINNLTREKDKLISCIWKYLVEENKTSIDNYTKKTTGITGGINTLNLQIDELKSKIRDLNNEIIEGTKNITSVQPTIDEINRTLTSFGFLNFHIVPSSIDSNHYQIQRENGILAESTLSEGEITFITFLYFLQLCKGSISKENITEDRILVIDDPISSLDSNVLFIVSSLLKEIIKKIKDDNSNIKQLILLTHNVYFHKEVSFIDGRTEKCKHTHFWVLRKKDKSSLIQSFEMKNPIETSYGLLWEEIKNRDKSSNISIQNTMRRIIENYFKLLGKYGNDDLINKFSNLEEKEICKSLISWINDGSHTIPDDLFIEKQDVIIENYFTVFKNIFIHTDHEGHFNMMMGENQKNSA
ncbi:hypothetical protein DVK85_01945 [Flavobacterium arcticum]|uniref:Protein CR006 P-loop domain-containing protein n=1 Tax=Flavobacterium arcticum TaxID=1784713 RepID=A0A345H8Z7_9FLAO|nr:AAA family ATPase [Flavobacterium arcticum]AXG73057.1 hypothetical protein DVK85_01945 [Flavobacterium arcticum]KAF2512850.1 AAA family ATPase [Flavobacterium arcticum]